MAYFNPYARNSMQPNVIIAMIQGGRSGAESYLLAPNTVAYLFDNEKSLFFIKQADQFGMPLPLREFSFSENKEEVSAPVEYATKADLESLKAQIEALKGAKDE